MRQVSKTVKPKKQENQNEEPAMKFDIQISLDDPQYYELPQQIECDFRGQRGDINLGPNLERQSAKMQQVAKELVDHYGTILKVWDIRDKEHYPFKFPPSSFNQKIEILEHKHQEIQTEYNQVRDLSPEQIRQIYQSGTFEIKSQKFPIPYVWQISQWIVKGRQNINRSYYYDLSLSYTNYKLIYQRIHSKRDDSKFALTLRGGYYHLISTPLLFLSILIGFREMHSPISLTQAHQNLEAQRQLKLRDNKNINLALYKFLLFTNDKTQILAEKKYQSLMNITNNDTMWRDIELQMQNQFDQLSASTNNLVGIEVEDQEQQEYKENLENKMNQQAVNYLKKYDIKIDPKLDIKEQIQKALYNVQIQMWKENSMKLNTDFGIHLKSLADCERVFQYHYTIYKNDVSKMKESFLKELTDKHKIKSQCNLYVQEQTNTVFKPRKAQLKLEMYQKVISELKQLKVQEVDILINYQEFSKDIQTKSKIELKNSNKLNQQPQITVTSTRKCFPPYKVLFKNDRYTLERDRTYSVQSLFYGWKIYLFCLRWFTWTVNVMFWLFANALSGPIGLRALFGISNFHPDVQIDSRTGVVSKSYYSVTPVIGRFIRVWDGMMRSRSNFESTPDNGFFGKNVARMWNYFEVYIFRFLLAGILGVLIIQPILILSNVVISLGMALTSWAWIPFALLFTNLFSYLFWDFDVSNRRSRIALWQSPKAFPLINNAWKLIVYGILQLVLSLLFIIIFHPVAILIMGIQAQLRLTLRSIYDFAMIYIVKKIGRVPVTQNALAWKISGPGVSRQYYFQLSNESFIVLIAAELEKCLLNEYKQRQSKLIRAPQKLISQDISNFFELFNASFTFYDKGSQLLEDLLNKQYQNRLNKLPAYNSHRIRFTQNELYLLLNQSKQFIKKQIQLKNLGGFIWNVYSVQKGDYNSLVQKIIESVFGSEILAPIEDIEMRFQLNQEECFDYQLKVQRALEGQVYLDVPSGFSVLPKTQKEVQIYRQFIPYNQILQQLWNCQSKSQQWSSKLNKSKRFYLNYCLNPQ